MKRNIKKMILYIIISFLFSCNPVEPLQDSGLTYVGIERNLFDFIASSQRTQMWCWAASIEMVFKYYGLNVTQEDIVKQTYGTDWNGNPPPFGGSIEIITNNLNKYSIDRSNQRYIVKARLYGPINPDAIFINEMKSKKPMILAYGPNINSGHVVVLTALSYGNNDGLIKTLIVRDPYPSFENIQNLGRKEYFNYVSPYGGLPNPIQAIWTIDVQLIN